MTDPIANLGLSCPKSGRFYICYDQPTRFIGCCTINPCTTDDGLCPDDDLLPSSFSSDAYPKILAQNCLDPGFLWYTCRDSSPPFLGCCSQDACEQTGCPRDKVGAAGLSGNKLQAAPFLSSDSSSTSSTSRTSSTTLSTAISTTASTTRSATTTATQPAAVTPPVHIKLSKGAIGGIVVGAVAGGCILALVAVWALRQQKKKKSPPTITAAHSSGSGRKDEYGEDSPTEYQDGTRHRHTLGAGAAQMAQSLHAQPSPGLESVISELPASPSTPGNRHIISMGSSDGVTGRESELSGLSVSTQQNPHQKQHSPLIHQSLFELEDSSSRTFVGR
ncbi:uncharacterized protein TRIVIDRAFT_230997 [Trichoderma virens Gv29-8]|uniref:Mid2 domain-containing protein n=1 Tax=Hypocrea virens (strain Gv29-8 / FGSC 10586) TaxID=413071 RepID=G9MXC2_HYPVG|nr:uncharacterized protein TRIVIDRAFT_230997 [Trichoderma virens Gv29-8]EHK20820.1 hypothetical protein TRIVIDRAFT_230997 [Trichoderma virens Gv29-8]UKZ56913.1 hypothetical protein TrVGV298_010759 [Trichoderma virens]